MRRDYQATLKRANNKKASFTSWLAAAVQMYSVLSYQVENVKRYGTEEHWYTQSQFWSKGKGWLTHVKDSTEKKDSCTYHKPNVPES